MTVTEPRRAAATSTSGPGGGLVATLAGTGGTNDGSEAPTAADAVEGTGTAVGAWLGGSKTVTLGAAPKTEGSHSATRMDVGRASRTAWRSLYPISGCSPRAIVSETATAPANPVQIRTGAPKGARLPLPIHSSSSTIVLLLSRHARQHLLDLRTLFRRQRLAPNQGLDQGGGRPMEDLVEKILNESLPEPGQADARACTGMRAPLLSQCRKPFRASFFMTVITVV